METCLVCGIKENHTSNGSDTLPSAADLWIQCDACCRWFHLSCVGLEEYEIVLIDKYHCPSCELLFGPCKEKKVLCNHRYDFDDPDGYEKPVQVGTAEFIENFKKIEASVPPLPKDYAVILEDGIELSREFEDKTEWTKIYRIRDKRGLGIGLPDSSFTVDDCVDLLGSERMVSVIDVYKQQTFQMSLGRFVEKFNSTSRQRLYNILSLEFSKTKLEQIVFPPTIVSQLSWVERYWGNDEFFEKTASPLSHEEHLKAKPEVSRYCLIGMSGSYTDFHIDFGGSSVWYHVFRGRKIFYVVPPTAKNLQLYIDYSNEKNHSEQLFSERLSKDSLFRIVLNSGETLLLPSGWIHAVYTPVDTLAFGGNFLHSLSVIMQLRIYEIETLLCTPARFLFPGFELVNWYAASEFIEQLKEFNDDPNCSFAGKKKLVQSAKKMLESLIHWSRNSQTNWSVLFSDVVTGLQKELKNCEKKKLQNNDKKTKSTPPKRLKMASTSSLQ